MSAKNASLSEINPFGVLFEVREL